MDVSTAGGALLITVLRLLHIVGGLIWVGAALVMSFYIEPALERAGAEGSGIIAPALPRNELSPPDTAFGARHHACGTLALRHVVLSRDDGQRHGHRADGGRACRVAGFCPWLFRCLAPCRAIRRAERGGKGGADCA